ncbi:hypothetical protein BaRGS_00020119 [Batillaria attramentaria]|uniref:Uncharacterized protein n=1 Tax=Batillaria attramentaria TaxID=370345 RepID=A0ABD0KN48_9CAEN
MDKTDLEVRTSYPTITLPFVSFVENYRFPPFAERPARVKRVRAGMDKTGPRTFQPSSDVHSTHLLTPRISPLMVHLQTGHHDVSAESHQLSNPSDYVTFSLSSLLDAKGPAGYVDLTFWCDPFSKRRRIIEDRMIVFAVFRFVGRKRFADQAT